MTKKDNNSSSASNPRRDFIKSSALGIGSLVFGTTSVGIIMPMVLKGSGLFSHVPDLMSKARIFISISILIIVAGIILVSLAGFERGKVLISKW